MQDKYLHWRCNNRRRFVDETPFLILDLLKRFWMNHRRYRCHSGLVSRIPGVNNRFWWGLWARVAKRSLDAMLYCLIKGTLQAVKPPLVRTLHLLGFGYNFAALGLKVSRHVQHSTSSLPVQSSSFGRKLQIGAVGKREKILYQQKRGKGWNNPKSFLVQERNNKLRCFLATTSGTAGAQDSLL